MNKLIISIIITATLVLLLNWRFPYILQTNEARLNLLYSSIILCAILPRLFEYDIAMLLKGFGVFILVTGLLFVGYVNRYDILNSKLVSSLMPMVPVVSPSGDVVVSAIEGGHFQVEASLNGNNIICLVDTGATSILIDSKDALNIGIKPENLNYNILTSTANGTGYAAKILVDDFQVGPIKLNNIAVMVNKEPLGACLLGMSFLNKLNKFTISKDQLIMTP